ncbi:hypothetical protein ACFQ1U_10145, partial [Tenacibaculum geojense]
MRAKITILLFSLLCTISYAQVKKEFSPRFSQGVNGNVTVIANNVLSRTATGNYNGDAGNHDFNNNVFVDIDSDNSTFNSSSANFSNPLPTASCVSIKKVFLYWAAANMEEDDPADELDWDFNQVKLMLPGSSTYQTLTADDVVFNGRQPGEHFVNDPYVCFKDITNLVTPLNTPYGKYQIANVRAKKGELISHINSNTGTSGGWQVVFIYESSILPAKNITIFDGYANVTRNTNNFEIDFDGFLTIPNGIVKADLLIGALEGDKDLGGDKFQIKDSSNNWIDISSNLRNSNNFFNSSISQNGVPFTDRNPASTNTLGFDSDVFPLSNPSNSVITNDQTSATVRLTSNQETYGLYLVGLSVDVWEPNIAPLLLSVNRPTGTAVSINEELEFSFEVENNGNDDVTNLQIETVLPDEIELVEPILNLPTGVAYLYNPLTRKLTFNILDGVTDVDFDAYRIAFKATVKDQCYFLKEYCSDGFSLQFTATYAGEVNSNVKTVISSSAINDCLIGDELPLLIPINRPAEGKWITPVGSLDEVIACDNVKRLQLALLSLPSATCNLPITKVRDEFIPNGCGESSGSYIREWTFTDKCGRESEVFRQTIIIEDTEAPVFNESLPTDVTVSCSEVPAAVTLT